MVDAVVSFAIERINDFLEKEINIRIGVKDGLRWVSDELSYLLLSVRAAEAYQENEIILLWIRNIREVAEEAVLILETASALREKHAGRGKGVVDFLPCCICKEEDSTFKLGELIESLKERVYVLKERRVEFSIDSMLAVHYQHKEQTDIVRKRNLLPATSFFYEADVVGFEDSFNTLLSVIHRGDLSIGYISIHGMGGSGKTTLASKLYNSPTLIHFKSRAWVCVSSDYNVKDVLKRLIKSFMREERMHEEDLSQMDEIDLLHLLRKFLEDVDGSYLAVIDDLWDIELWHRIKIAFPDKKTGSRVIFTTRNARVAMSVDGSCFVHKIHPLGPDESWQLFCSRAKPTPDLETLGKKMVDKCNGLPLAIVVLSGLLSHKKTYAYWSRTYDHRWQNLKDNYVEIGDILSLDMINLPSQLKDCFLYLARFPEDDIFDVDKIKLMWIAEEFISEADEGDGVLMEDVADYCLHELINRNLIQIVPTGGQVLVCRVHILLHDLAIGKAREHRLLGIFDGKQDLHPISVLEAIRRHVIYDGIGEYLKLFLPNSSDLHLRSLAVINETKLVEPEDVKLMYTRFIYLKVLDLMGIELDEMAEEIGDMVLLKFLGLMANMNNEPLIIPSTISKLKRLQTLFGSGNSSYNFPSEIGELGKLRHIKFAHTTANLKIRNHQTDLQTLEVIPYEDWIQIDTANFSNLHTLAITDDPYTPSDTHSLDSIAKLRSLRSFALYFLHSSVIPTIMPLTCCELLTSVTLKGIIKDSSELSFLPDSVTNLTLHGSKFTEDPMPTLGSLVNLAVLHLDEVYMGKVMVSSDHAFPSLQILKLENFPDLEEWQVQDGAMPSLKASQVDGCEKLKMIPQRLKEADPISVTFTYLKFT